MIRFSPASRIILIESLPSRQGRSWFDRFQSRKQDYFNWKIGRMPKPDTDTKFQSRKQDYFNWKDQQILEIN